MAYLRRELKWLFYQKKSIFLMVFVLLFFIFFMSFLYRGQMTEEATLSKIKLGFVDEDESMVSRLVLANLKQDKNLSKLLDIQVFSREKADEAMAKNEIDGAILLTPGFGDALYYYEKAEIQVLLNEKAPFRGQMLLGMLRAYSGLIEVVDNVSYSYFLALKEAKGGDLAPDFLIVNSTEWMLRALSKGGFYREVVVGKYPSTDSFLYFSVAFSLLMMLLFSSASMEEVVYLKETDILKRAKTVPRFWLRFLSAKLLVAWAFQSLLFGILFVFLSGGFGLWSHYGPMLAGIVFIQFFFLALFFFVGALASDSIHYVGFSNGLALFLGFLGGAFFPITRMNEGLKTLAQFMPNQVFQKNLLMSLVGQEVKPDLLFFLWLFVGIILLGLGIRHLYRTEVWG